MSKKALVITGLVLLLGIYLLLCLISPAAYSYKDEIKITGPYKMAYVIINDMKDWSKWHSWKSQSPDVKIKMGGRELNVGANFTMEDSPFGDGYAELLEAFQDSLVTAKIKGTKIPNELRLNWQIIKEGTKFGHVNFNARIVGKIPFIQRGWYYGLQNKLDKLFQNDLQGMKNYIENAVKGDFGVEKVPYKKQHFFGKLDIVSNAKIPKFYARYYPQIYKMLDSMNIDVAGPPVGLIYSWEASTGLVALMAALPVNEKIPHITGWSSMEVDNTECLLLKNFGNYNTLRNAHAKMNYVMDNSPYTLMAPIIEEYVTSPSQEPDTSKWLTNVYYLLDTRGGYMKTLEHKITLEEAVKMQEEERNEYLKKILSERN